MGISEEQLQTWSKQGAVRNAKRSHEHVRGTLNGSLDCETDIFLQGSYRNTTNIRGDSDVDIVVQLNDVWRSDKAALSRREKEIYDSRYSTASYSFSQFRQDVLSALEREYGLAAVEDGNKAIKINSSRVPLFCDVVPCFQFRKYVAIGESRDDYIEGITFKPADGSGWIVNFPKEHYDNGTWKNSVAGGKYKSSIRMFKNARNRCIELGLLSDAVRAPSYFLECLLYNVPAEKFKGTSRSTYNGVARFLRTNSFVGMQCQNEQQNLFGSGSTKWSFDDANETVSALQGLWDKE